MAADDQQVTGTPAPEHGTGPDPDAGAAPPGATRDGGATPDGRAAAAAGGWPVRLWRFTPSEESGPDGQEVYEPP